MWYAEPACQVLLWQCSTVAMSVYKADSLSKVAGHTVCASDLQEHAEPHTRTHIHTQVRSCVSKAQQVL